MLVIIICLCALCFCFGVLYPTFYVVLNKLIGSKLTVKELLKRA